MVMLRLVYIVLLLQVLPVSKFQANQRAGRAGRESAGECFRLFTEGILGSLKLGDCLFKTHCYLMFTFIFSFPTSLHIYQIHLTS
jgi:hypothetical protein